ncbi:transposase domain-containing protein [Methylobacterium oryzae]|uniref:transposase domain-containing protein n=1 Tax=Methylobacterium oryzae TaxID=334852 RepID=UPI003AF6ACFB
METAKLNELDPEAGLRDVLTRLAAYRPSAWPSYCPGTGRRPRPVLRPPDRLGHSSSAYSIYDGAA